MTATTTLLLLVALTQMVATGIAKRRLERRPRRAPRRADRARMRLFRLR